MLAQRIAQQSLRRLAAQPNAYRFVTPAAIATGSGLMVQRRLVAAQAVSGHDAQTEILAKQRRNRPVAPHLTIYRPQITWYLSMLNRLTGIMVSGTFYLYGGAYLVAPYIGWHLETASLAAAFAAWPLFLQVATKTLVALPFTFHCINGVRHLTWDTAKMITNKQVNQTGWIAVGLTFATSLALAFL